MKRIFYAIFLLLFVASCSSSDDDNKDDKKNDGGVTPPPNPTEDLVTINLSTNKDEANIFELVSFRITPSETVNMHELKESYDSVVWIVPETGRCKILEGNFDNNGSTIIYSWSHNFFLPGKYETLLVGYKNDKALFSDTVSVTITDKNDFLGINWSDIKATATHSTGYADMFDNFNFLTFESVKNDTPSVTFFVPTRGNSIEEETLFAEKARHTIYHEIESLYSTPTYTEDDISKVQEMYQQLFTNKPEDREPLCIWVTPKSKIALLRYMDEYTNYYEYSIYAEPNN